MERFNLNTWLEDKSRKIVTRNGKPVRIVCWDKLGDYPIIGCIKYSDDYEDFETYNIDGSKYSFNREDQNDLFFEDEEERLTDFEKAVEKTIPYKIPTDMLKSTSQQLLEVARKELEKENPYSGKPNQEWSKEDEDMIECIIAAIKMGDYHTQDELNRMTSWLKSLNTKHWKPTDKQMEDFRMLLDYNIGVFDYAKFMSVDSLYEDLKKNLIDE